MKAALLETMLDLNSMKVEGENLNNCSRDCLTLLQ